MTASLLLRGYRDPRGVMARHLADTGISRSTEGQSLVYLVLACVIGAIATLPGAVEIAPRLEAEARPGIVPAHLFGYLFVAPLIGYALAACVHLIARTFGGDATFVTARLAVFWSMLLGAPLALVVTAARHMVPETALRLVVIAASAYWLWLAAAGLAEAEGFGRTSRVAVVMVGVIAMLVAGLAILSDGALLARR